MTMNSIIPIRKETESSAGHKQLCPNMCAHRNTLRRKHLLRFTKNVLHQIFNCLKELHMLLFCSQTFIDILWISHHVSRSHSSPHPPTSFLCPCNLPPQNKTKFRRQTRQTKETKQNKEKNLVLESVMGPCVSPSSPFTCKCSLP